MSKYVHRRIEIEPERFWGKPVRGVCTLSRCFAFSDKYPHVHTIHSHQAIVLKIGDWIIPEEDGVHFYPCKPDIFEKIYELVEG